MSTRVFETAPLANKCLVEPQGGCTWSPYERLAQRVPVGAHFVVGSKGLIDVFYRGERIGGGDGTDSRYHGKGGLWRLRSIRFDTDACKWPLIIVARKLAPGQARDSFGISTYYDGKWRNGGCELWPGNLIRCKGSSREDAAYTQEMGRCSYSDVQAWRGVGIRVGDPFARTLGPLRDRQIYNPRASARTLVVAATLPFCQGGSLE